MGITQEMLHLDNNYLSFPLLFKGEERTVFSKVTTAAFLLEKTGRNKYPAEMEAACIHL